MSDEINLIKNSERLVCSYIFDPKKQARIKKVFVKQTRSGHRPRQREDYSHILGQLTKKIMRGIS